MKNDHSCDVADVVEHEFRVCSPIETGPVPPTATRRARTRQASHSPPRGPGAGLAGAVPLSADTSPAGRPSGTEDGDGCVPSLEKGATAAPLSRTSRGKGEVTGPAPGPPVSAPQAVSSEAAGGKPSSQEAASIQGRALRALQAAAAAGASTEAACRSRLPRQARGRRSGPSPKETTRPAEGAPPEEGRAIGTGRLATPWASTPGWTRPCGATRR